ncbi:carbohydrate ABC transporter permease [Pelagicoccus sp. NFK12]|uniref:Carbohydrate ABC transporter permease n=1 Tax=Pelagicoccus enzymogenes TaxID=2773457 RepID=A0A927FDD6_9BACT|nr:MULTISPECIES: carbohydrate ABC transporter permease [Pelagicoccus]MBD5781625.1 carbohydrate ABC transporter permease [Pelagicoccus enzymogenes]
MITIAPFLMTILLSVKSSDEVIHDFWAPPEEIRWDFFAQALGFIQHSIFNSAITASVSVILLAFLSSLSGYVFARIQFPGKELIYLLILALMMVPGILTLIPMFLWYKQFPFVGGNDWLGQGGHGFLNTPWVLLVHYIAGGQVLGIILCRTYIENLPQSLFDSARIDGASELQIYRSIALPLCLPVIATVSILSFVGIYNDYMWPLITIDAPNLQTFTLRVTQYSSEHAQEHGPEFASYIIGSIPLIIVFAFGMKYYVNGITKGSIKG